MDIAKRKWIKHFTYTRKRNIRVLELETLFEQIYRTIDKKDTSKVIDMAIHAILSRINMSNFGMILRMSDRMSGRAVLSNGDIISDIDEVLVDALSTFLVQHDTAFYDAEHFAVEIIESKSGNKHSLIIYPKLDFPID